MLANLHIANLLAQPASHARTTLVRLASRLALGLSMLASGVSVNAQSHPLMPLCGACHGAEGNSSMPGTPSLAGQPKLFIENQLVLIREGLREIPAMKGLLDKVKDEDFSTLAKIYSEMTAKPSTTTVDEAKAKRGADLSKQGLCGNCHLPDYSGREQMPRLAAQREDFLFANMKQFRDGTTTGRDTMMTNVLRGMTDAQISDMAHFFATRPR
jgi:cytochrome c553